MTYTISLDASTLQTLDLSSARSVIQSFVEDDDGPTVDKTVRFEIDYPREAEDPRELSEIPEIRLWFIRLDSEYPWLPLYLDWEGGELARYTAMLVPHQFSPLDGIRYNPEALEIFVMHKIFVISQWLTAQNLEGQSKLKQMIQTLGYELDDGLFRLLGD